MILKDKANQGTKDKASEVWNLIGYVLKKNWVFHTIIVFLPGFYSSILLRYTFLKSFFFNSDGGFTVSGWIATASIYFLSFLLLLYNTYMAEVNRKKEEETLKQGFGHLQYNYDILKYVISSIFSVSKKKYERFVDFISGYNKIEGYDPFNKLTQPDMQIQSILEAICHCFYKITSIDMEDMAVTLAYQLDGKWNWSCGSDTTDGLSLDELTTNPKTTFHKLIYGPDKFLFYNSKKEAADLLCYVYDNKDSKQGQIGSIICKEIYVGKHEEKYIIAVLSISTYGKQLVKSSYPKEEYDKKIANVKETINDVVFKQFEQRIILELSLLYIKQQQNKNDMYFNTNASEGTENNINLIG